MKNSVRAHRAGYITCEDETVVELQEMYNTSGLSADPRTRMNSHYGAAGSDQAAAVRPLSEHQPLSSRPRIYVTSVYTRQLKAMLYRNGLMKFRNIRNVFVEVLVPALLVALVSLLKLIDQAELRHEVPNFPVYRVRVPLRAERVFVAPDSTEVMAFMEDVKQTMTGNLPQFDRAKSFELSFYSNGNDLLNTFLANNVSSCVAVIFDDSKLDMPAYTIRFDSKVSQILITSTIPADRSVKDRDTECRRTNGLGEECSAFDYLASGIVYLQSVIDWKFIKLHSQNYELPLPEIKTQMLPWRRRISLTNGVRYTSGAAPFIVFGLSFALQSLISEIVREKEKHLKDTMQIMGLRYAIFWLSWFLLYFAVYIGISLVSLGLLYGFHFFQMIDPFLLFVIFLLHGAALLNLGFIISAFFDNSRTAGTVGPLILAGLVFLGAVPTVWKDDFPVWGLWVLGLLSPSMVVVLLDQLLILDMFVNPIANRATNFLDVGQVTIKGNFAISSGMWLLAMDFVIYLVLALYCDMVVPSELGRRYHPFFFLQPSYYKHVTPRAVKDMVSSASFVFRGAGDGSIAEAATSAAARLDAAQLRDVEIVPPELQEHALVRTYRLRKTFRAVGSGKERQVIAAVDGVTLQFYENEITAVLGHAGAGKTTLLNLLIGTLASTDGAATVCGYSINSPAELEEARKRIGICPQYDVLTDRLTPLEHLRFYAMLKGIYTPEFQRQANLLLRDVGLYEKRFSYAGHLSGGQKRKLGVAIALIGDPQVIFLDEPSSGVDVASQRFMWDVLRRYKRGRAIIMSTQFMQEADVLADRKVILCQGRVRCGGTSIYLKNRFGIGYHLTIALKNPTKPTTENGREDCAAAITRLIERHVRGAQKSARSLSGELDYLLPKEEVDYFPSLFDALEQDQLRAQLGITDYGISMTSLEEVFLKLNETGSADELFGGDDVADTSTTAFRTFTAGSKPGKIAAGEAADDDIVREFNSPLSHHHQHQRSDASSSIHSNSGEKPVEAMRRLRRESYTRAAAARAAAAAVTAAHRAGLNASDSVAEMEVANNSTSGLGNLPDSDVRDGEIAVPVLFQDVGQQQPQMTRKQSSESAADFQVTSGASVPYLNVSANSDLLPLRLQSQQFDVAAARSRGAGGGDVEANRQLNDSRNNVRAGGLHLATLPSHIPTTNTSDTLASTRPLLSDGYRGDSSKFAWVTKFRTNFFIQKLWAVWRIRLLTMLRAPVTYIFQILLPITTILISFFVVFRYANDPTVNTVTLLRYAREEAVSASNPFFTYNDMNMPKLGQADYAQGSSVAGSDDAFRYYNYTLETLVQYLKEMPSISPSTLLSKPESEFLGVSVAAVGGGFSGTSRATLNRWLLLYNDSRVHSMPAGINLLDAALYRAILRNSTTQITTRIWPFPPKKTDENVIRDFSNKILLGLMIIQFGLGFVPGGFGVEIVKDRESHIAQQLRISGCSFYTYWLSFYLTHMSFFVIPMLAIIGMIFALNVSYFTPPPMMLCFLLLLAMHLHTVTLTMYVLSFFFNKYSRAQTFIPAFANAANFVFLMILLLLGTIPNRAELQLGVHIVSGLLYPGYLFYGGVYYAGQAAQLRLASAGKVLTFADIFLDRKVLVSLILSMVQCWVLPLVIVWFDALKQGNTVWQTLGYSTAQVVVRNPDEMNSDVPVNEDDDVKQERIHAESFQPTAATATTITTNNARPIYSSTAHIARDATTNSRVSLYASENSLVQRRRGSSGLSASPYEPVVLVKRLRKEFNQPSDTGDSGNANGGSNFLARMCGDVDMEGPDKTKVVVRNLSFHVAPGEVFGLLGPNGAGKTTTISMILKLINPTAGQIFINGYDPSCRFREAFRSMGYCPQFDALWDDITVEETLITYALLKNVPANQAAACAHKFIAGLRLQEEAQKRVKNLSGGVRRKVSYALAMLGDPQTVLLDEPSTGMDPTSKRFLWDTILETFSASGSRGAILTTHSMEEADALCARVAIMVHGEIKCIGSTQHLKNKFGSGYMLEIKLPVTNATTVNPVDVAAASASFVPVTAGLNETPQNDSEPLPNEGASDIAAPNDADQAAGITNRNNKSVQTVEHFAQLPVATNQVRPALVTLLHHKAPSQMVRDPRQRLASSAFDRAGNSTAADETQQQSNVADGVVLSTAERMYIIHDRIRQMFPHAEVLEWLFDRIIWRIPQHEMGKLSATFRALEMLKREFGIEEYNLSQTSLEQVFLQFAREQGDYYDAAHMTSSGHEMHTPIVEW